MKKTVFLLLFASFFAGMANAQTKRIAHRSHSGSNAEFNLDGDGNFGLPRYVPPPKPASDCNNLPDSTKRYVDSLRPGEPKQAAMEGLDRAAEIASRTHR